MVIKAILRDAYALKFANSLTEGVNCVLTSKVDLVLLDLNLPDGHGASLFAKLQNAFNLIQFPPMIAITTDTSNASCERAYIAGCKTLLKKPFSRNELNETVQRIIQSKNEKRIEGPITVGAFSFYPATFSIRSRTGEKSINLEGNQLAYLMLFDLALTRLNKLSFCEFYKRFGQLSPHYDVFRNSVDIERINFDLKKLDYKIQVRDEEIELRRIA